MNYAYHYDRLIERARNRKIDGYVEEHHIIPRCMGGGDNKDNLVKLTPEEHYVAHQLLVKMHPGHAGLVWAASNMTGKTARHQRNNKLYGWLRRRLSEQMKQFKHSDETKKKLSEMKMGNKSRLGMKHTAGTKAKMSAASKGKPKSAAHVAASSRGKTGKPGRKLSQQEIINLQAASKLAREKGRYAHLDTPEYKEKVSIQSKKTMLYIWEQRRMGLLPMPATRTK